MFSKVVTGLVAGALALGGASVAMARNDVRPMVLTLPTAAIPQDTGMGGGSSDQPTQRKVDRKTGFALGGLGALAVGGGIIAATSGNDNASPQ